MAWAMADDSRSMLTARRTVVVVTTVPKGTGGLAEGDALSVTEQPVAAFA